MAGYGLGSAMGAAVRGYREGESMRLSADAAKHAASRQQVNEQQQDTQFAQQQADRTEFDVPAKRAQASAQQQAVKRDQMRRDLSQAAARKDLAAISRIYNDGVDDGQTADLSWTPDGQVQISHSTGKKWAAPFDDVVWGKPDGTGLGLWDMLDPEGMAARREKGQDRKAKMEDTKAEYGLRGSLADKEHGHRLGEIRTTGAETRASEMLRGGTPFAADDGSMYMLRPDATTAAVERPGGGGPMKAPAYGMPGGRGGRAGTTADIENNRYAAKMAIRSDKTGTLAKLPPDDVEAMVYQASRLGKDRVARQKLLGSMLSKAQTNNKYADPQELGEQVRAMDEALEVLLPPEPTVPPTQGAEPSAGEYDPLGLLGGGLVR